MREGCRKGADCEFQHPSECKFLAKEVCRRGKDRKLRQSDPSKPAAVVAPPSSPGEASAPPYPPSPCARGRSPVPKPPGTRAGSLPTFTVGRGENLSAHCIAQSERDSPAAASRKCRCSARANAIDYDPARGSSTYFRRSAYHSPRKHKLADQSRAIDPQVSALAA